MKTSVKLSVLLLVGLQLAGAPASAQSIDYGALEKLFGEPVTTSATGKPQRASEVPVTMDIITADEIRRSGATSIPDILRHHAGVNVWQWSRTDFDVGIRGYNQTYSPRLLVLVNGRQIYTNDFNYTTWSSIPVQPEEIRQIEIVKGPQTALFGFNAVGGVINIITYNPAYDHVTNAGVRIGSDKDRQVHAVYTAPKLGDRLNMRLSGDLSGADDFNESRKAVPATNPRQGAVNLDTVTQISEKSQLRVELSRSQTDQREATPGQVFVNSRYLTKDAKVDYVADTDVGVLQATVYRTWLNQDASLGVFNNISTVAQLSDLFKLGSRHTFRVQAEYRTNNSESDVFFGSGAKLGYSVDALSGMWDWALRDNLSWTNAARVDHLALKRTVCDYGHETLGLLVGFHEQFCATFAISPISQLITSASNLLVHKCG
jgi:outer membrane receptor for ferrienterochelin and colicins